MLDKCRLIDGGGYRKRPLSEQGNLQTRVENVMKLMNLYRSNDKCCGCGACATACPRDCIRMAPDHEGFLYPSVDEERCVRCGRCESVCPVQNASDTGQKNDSKCYVGFSNDRSVRKNSSSGGIFTELAEQVITNAGIVYGAGFDSDFEVKHFSISSKEDISLLRGSKYVQSRLGDVYSKVNEALKSGKLVYFSGTPCQVAGLYAFLGSRPDHLITQDLICHGVGSPMVWRKYLEQYGKIKQAAFRSKKYGWHYFSMHIETNTKNVYKRLDEDIYLRLFLDNLILRPICYDCPIKKSGSQADITLADCWSPQRVTSEVADFDEGLSLVIANTEKGQCWIEHLKNNKSAALYSVDTKKAFDSQSALTQSVQCPKQREKFFYEIEKKDFSLIAKEWYPSSFMRTIRVKYIFLKTKIRFRLLGIQKRGKENAT